MLPSRATDPPAHGGYIEITTITTTYTYYPDNMRKSKGSTKQIWIGDEIALDMNGNSVVSSYIHGNKLIESGYGWYLYNAHGDVVQLADDSGDVTHDYDYDPFGVERGSNAGENPYRYAGEYFDTESGYVYLRARYYVPGLGRFVSEIATQIRDISQYF